MSEIRRKIGFYSLKLKKKRKEEYIDTSIVEDVFDYLGDLDEPDRVMDQSTTKSSKFHFFRKSVKKSSHRKILFTSAKYRHRPPLIDKDTASRRDNPKTLTEGEEEKTHVLFKYIDDEIICLLEEHRSGISINSLVKYLTKFIDIYLDEKDEERKWSFELSIIPKDDFMGELKSLDRVSVGQIYADKKILGSEFLNYSNKTKPLKQDLVLTMRAETKGSLFAPIKDIYKKYSDDEGQISKIRVHGTDVNGHKILLDTDLIKKVNYVDAIISENTGVVKSREFFEALEEILEE